MISNFLKHIVTKIVCIFCVIFLCITSSQAYNYSGIVIFNPIINLLKKNIDDTKLKDLYGSSEYFVDFSKIYAIINSDDLYKMNFVIPIMNCEKIKVIGEITGNVVLKDYESDINALYFIQNCDLCSNLKKIRLEFDKTMAKFFIFGGVPCSKYIPSIFKNQKLPKPITKKVENTAYHYLPLKDKLD